MREHFTTKAVIEPAGNGAEQFDLKYFKTSFESESDGGSTTVYGVLVAKCAGDDLLEEADSGPISGSEVEICSLMEQLAENTVTPMVLHEILDDLIT